MMFFKLTGIDGGPPADYAVPETNEKHRRGKFGTEEED